MNLLRMKIEDHSLCYFFNFGLIVEKTRRFQHSTTSSANSLSTMSSSESVISIPSSSGTFDSATFPTTGVANLRLRTLDYYILRSKDWINDSIVYAAQKLLKQQFAYIDGFQDAHCGPNCSFRVLPLDGRYVQILHADGNHWVQYRLAYKQGNTGQGTCFL